jgi:golgi phosphoprotein 3
MLTFVEEIVLLQLDDARGKVVDLPSQAAAIVLAGAALMELALRNQLDTDLKHLFVVDRTPSGDDILDDVLAQLTAIPGELTAAAALQRISAGAEGYREKALEHLVAKGVLREQDGRFLWVFGSRQYPVVDDREQRAVKARLHQLLLSEEIPDPRDVALICLIEASGLLGLVLTADEAERAAARVEQLAKMDLIGQALMRAIAEIRFIVKAAIASNY